MWQQICFSVHSGRLSLSAKTEQWFNQLGGPLFEICLTCDCDRGQVADGEREGHGDGRHLPVPEHVLRRRPLGLDACVVDGDDHGDDQGQPEHPVVDGADLPQPGPGSGARW